MASSRATPPRAHGSWRGPRAEAARRLDEAKTGTAVATAVSALRRGRQAVVEVDGHLDDLLGWLADPRQALARDLPDRLAASARRAGEALTGIGLLCSDGPAGSELF